MTHIPTKKLESKKQNSSKARCDKCGNLYRVRGLVKFKGKFLCGNCRKQLPTFRAQVNASNYIKPTNLKTIEEVLNKVYEVKYYINKRGYRNGYIQSFPKCMIGKKFKIVLVK
ncbi:MAG: hypothetical protein ACFFG0_02900 [Candidatus Thorarchaeota archaeon]